MSPAAKYMSQAELARELGVGKSTVNVWRTRYGDFPEPDVIVGEAPGWLAERLPEILRWKESRPGQGAGGGRPRRDL
jgi:transposase